MPTLPPRPSPPWPPPAPRPKSRPPPNSRPPCGPPKPRPAPGPAWTPPPLPRPPAHSPPPDGREGVVPAPRWPSWPGRDTWGPCPRPPALPGMPPAPPPGVRPGTAPGLPVSRPRPASVLGPPACPSKRLPGYRGRPPHPAARRRNDCPGPRRNGCRIPCRAAQRRAIDVGQFAPPGIGPGAIRLARGEMPGRIATIELAAASRIAVAHVAAVVGIMLPVDVAESRTVEVVVVVDVDHVDPVRVPVVAPTAHAR